MVPPPPLRHYEPLSGGAASGARPLGLGECVLETTQTALRFYERLGYVKSEQSYPLLLTGLPATVLRKVLEPLKG